MSLETLKTENKKKKSFQVLSKNLQTRTTRCHEISFSFIDSKSKPNDIDKYLTKSGKTGDTVLNDVLFSKK